MKGGKFDKKIVPKSQFFCFFGVSWGWKQLKCTWFWSKKCYTSINTYIYILFFLTIRYWRLGNSKKNLQSVLQDRLLDSHRKGSWISPGIIGDRYSNSTFLVALALPFADSRKIFINHKSTRISGGSFAALCLGGILGLSMNHSN